MESRRLRRRFLVPALALGSGLAVFTAVTCFGPPVCSLADPGNEQGATAFVFPFPSALQGEITRLNNEANDKKAPQDKRDKAAKKAWILDTALKNLLPQPFKSEASLTGLKYLEDYRFDLSKQPATPGFNPKYFADPFKNNSITVKPESSGHFDYRNDEVWLDFANYKLGGGVFGDGMVQEETMALTMPQLADAAAIGYNTRSQGKAGVLGSNPTPVIITKVQRSIELDRSLYKDGWLKLSLDQIKNPKITRVQSPNQHLSVLAVAVEKLDGSHAQQFGLDTMLDLFNTFVAAFTLAKEVKPNTIINTGPIGTGDFENDPEVIYVMQNLAAQEVGGITLRYWGYDPKSTEQKEYDPMVNDIIATWKKDADKKVLNLLLIAHGRLTHTPSG
jgi:Poly (ADP-ribose) glycohydrolase (PARG)